MDRGALAVVRPPSGEWSPLPSMAGGDPRRSGGSSRGAAGRRRARSVGDAGCGAGVAARELADVGVADGVARRGAVRRGDVARRREDGQQPSRRGRPELRRRRRDRRAAVGSRGGVGQHAVRGRPGRRLTMRRGSQLIAAARGASLQAAASSDRPTAALPTASRFPRRRPRRSSRRRRPTMRSRRAAPSTAALAYVASTDDLMAHSPVGRREIFRKLVDARLGRRHSSSRSSRRRRELATTLDVPVERLVWVEAPIYGDAGRQRRRTRRRSTCGRCRSSVRRTPGRRSRCGARSTSISSRSTSRGWLVDEATADAGPTPAANELVVAVRLGRLRARGWLAAVVEGVGL